MIAGLLARVAEAIDAQADELGRLDSVAGDGDHGIGMQRGSRAGARGGRGRRPRPGRVPARRWPKPATRGPTRAAAPPA